MESVQVPLPNFGFDEIAKEKARFIIQQILHNNSLMQYFKGSNPGLEDRLQFEIEKLFEDYERLICIVELLTFLSREEVNLQNNISFYSLQPSLMSIGFNKIRYRLYHLAKAGANYTFDSNAFSLDEIGSINLKINDVLDVLSKLQAGQEVLFDEFEEVKSHIANELESLKASPALGKKTFYQLMLGKIATFTGNKIADEILKKLEPHIIALLLVHASHLVTGVQKLIE